MNLGDITVATTGELHAIIQELELVDIGDAASYLGEEVHGEEKFLGEDQIPNKLSDVEMQSISLYREQYSQGR